MRLRTYWRLLLVTLLVAGGRSDLKAAIWLNEVMVNPPGTDNGFEFFELRSTTGGVEAMTGLTMLVIENESAAGTIDAAFNLGSFSTGTNGLFLWRDSATVINPAPAAATVVNIADINPDFENGSQTYVIVSGFSGSVGTDLDAGNDGIFDSTPWTSVIDAMGYRDNSGSEVSYGAGLGFVDFPTPGPNFEPEAALRVRGTGQWLEADINGASPGPYNLDSSETLTTSGAMFNTATLSFTTLSPGNENPMVVPEPAALVLAGISVFATSAIGRRRRGAELG